MPPDYSQPQNGDVPPTTETGSQSKQDSIASEDFVNQNIETFLELRTRAEQQVDRHQRAVELVTSFVGRPFFLYCILVFVTVWVIVNTLPYLYGLEPFDEPPYFWLQGIIGLSALLMTTIILITQRRQGKLAKLEAQLDIQVSVLTEQKIAKLIALVEELRQDLPNVKNRYDAEAKAMQKSADPKTVMLALESSLEATTEGVLKLEEKTEVGVAALEEKTEAGVAVLEEKIEEVTELQNHASQP
ncbi:MAG: DUF1003 domain-containing protein [Gemmatimonadaceae bacterium]|nr:DUF1003 domain-containing protein [Gloeobacterales cyanobacterium ES-bin-141]